MVFVTTTTHVNGRTSLRDTHGKEEVFTLTHTLSSAWYAVWPAATCGTTNFNSIGLAYKRRKIFALLILHKHTHTHTPIHTHRLAQTFAGKYLLLLPLHKLNIVSAEHLVRAIAFRSAPYAFRTNQLHVFFGREPGYYNVGQACFEGVQTYQARGRVVVAGRGI